MARVYENFRKPKREGKKLTIGPADALPEGRGAKVLLKDETEVAIFKAEGKIYAIENFCPHRGSPLEDSRTYGTIVECDFHGWRFDLSSGECLTNPDCPLETYPILIEDGLIKLVI